MNIEGKMGTCSTCKHWEENQPQSEDDIELGIVAPIYDSIEWGKCLLSATHNGEIKEGAIFASVDWESYNSILLTRPSFGCNQWSAKDANL